MVIAIENAIKDVGELGRYQLLISALLIIPATFPCAFVGFNQIFVSATPDHWCRVPELLELGVPLALRKNLSIPYELRDGIRRHKQCEMYAVNYSAMYSEASQVSNTMEFDRGKNFPTQKCIHGWEYDHKYYDATLVTEFDLVCENNWWPTLNTSLFYVGSLLGTILFGWVTDKFGRRLSFIIVMFLVVILPTASAFSPNYKIFTIYRFFIGFLFPSIYQVPFIIAIELTGSKHRTGIGMIYGMLYGIAMSAFCGLAAILRHWFSITLVSGAPFVVLLVYWWIIPESPRWLVSKNRMDEAEDILQMIANVNGKVVPQNILGQVQRKFSFQNGCTAATENVSKVSTNPLVLFSTPNMFKKTTLIMFIWLANAILYVGLSYMSANLGINDYLALAISGIVEAPACLLGWYAMEKWGRRWTTFIMMFLVGCCCAGTIFVTPDNVWLNVLLPSLGKFGITGTFSVVYIFGCELIPTVVRGNGLAMCGIFCSIGLVATPYLIYLVVYHRILPLIIMGVLSIFGGMASLFLPETFNEDLPQTLEDGENFGKNLQVLPFKIWK